MMLETLTSLVALTLLEVVLSIDNLVVIAVLVSRLPPEQQARARFTGMAFALGLRLIMLFFISWIISLEAPLFHVFGNPVSGKDLIVAVGGLFLIYKATEEIHAAIEGEDEGGPTKIMASFGAAVAQIALINMVFSIDSIVTAIGMTKIIWVMAVSIILSMIVLMVASGPVARFVQAHPTVKILALGFLIMIGMTLVAEGAGVHVPKGYVYTAMLFSIFIEVINMVGRKKRIKNVETIIEEKVEERVAQRLAEEGEQK